MAIPGRPRRAATAATVAASAAVLAAGCSAGPAKPASPGGPAASHSAVAGLAVGAQRQALAARYLAVAQAGNKRLEVEFDRLHEEDRIHLAAATVTSARSPPRSAGSTAGCWASRSLRRTSGLPGSCPGSTRRGRK